MSTTRRDRHRKRRIRLRAKRRAGRFIEWGGMLGYGLYFQLEKDELLSAALNEGGLAACVGVLAEKINHEIARAAGQPPYEPCPPHVLTEWESLVGGIPLDGFPLPSKRLCGKCLMYVRPGKENEPA